MHAAQEIACGAGKQQQQLHADIDLHQMGGVEHATTLEAGSSTGKTMSTASLVPTYVLIQQYVYWT